MVSTLLERLGVAAQACQPGGHAVYSPVDGARLASVRLLEPGGVQACVGRAAEAFQAWRQVPAPRRGELVRRFGEALRAHKAELGELVCWETGKIRQEGLGEVQEMIDICDFAVGLSRQLYGLTIASERPGHHMRESWQPLGVVAVISAFNFPVAVWAWNAALALVCGNPVVWKPSEKTPLSALACQALFERVAADFADAPAQLCQVSLGGREVGQALAEDPRVALVSATGSTRMGRELAPKLAARFARSILELGGNNAMILAPSADLELAVRAILFGAVGTAGQRCTSLRRLIVHETLKAQVLARLQAAYADIRIGHPLQGSLVGPLIDAAAFHAMQAALDQARAEGGQVFGGERRLEAQFPEAYYVAPAIVEMPAQSAVVCQETFAPILYVLGYREFAEAVALNNAVPQGLSSCLFSNDVREAEAFMSATGSDCGIANVNLGPSGAEIGAAFGGEKDSGGGRESGSDAWKAYMRRQTNTVNYSRQLPLAQGIVFD